MKLLILINLITLCFSFDLLAQFPNSPADENHPGSQIYNYDFNRIDFKCSGKEVSAYLPDPLPPQAPLIVFGHGQGLGVNKYDKTLIHIAKKGIIAIHPEYDNGFFDTNWTKMGENYNSLTKCAVDKFSQINQKQIVFSGHSKGAYVAGIAAGLSFNKNLDVKPSSILLFNPAGLDQNLISKIPNDIELTVVHSDEDSIVDEKISTDIYNFANVNKKQFIKLRSYTKKNSGKSIDAGHMWILTESAFFSGGPPGPLHYYSGWKWLVAAAEDLSVYQSEGTHPYLYGPLAIDKGISTIEDEIIKNF